jgi:hypothetical protein
MNISVISEVLRCYLVFCFFFQIWHMFTWWGCCDTANIFVTEKNFPTETNGRMMNVTK